MLLTKSAHKNSLKLSLITRFDGQPAGLTKSTWLNFAFFENPYNAIKLAPTSILLMIPLLWDIKTGVKYLWTNFWLEWKYAIAIKKMFTKVLCQFENILFHNHEEICLLLTSFTSFKGLKVSNFSYIIKSNFSYIISPISPISTDKKYWVVKHNFVCWNKK